MAFANVAAASSGDLKLICFDEPHPDKKRHALLITMMTQYTAHIFNVCIGCSCLPLTFLVFP
jgi:hypothetical protein